jgi:hypothetical protein
MRERKLLDWLPPLFRETDGYRVLFEGAGQPEIDPLWAMIDTLWDEQFIQSASEQGVLRWEGLTGLPPAGSLEERRNAVLARVKEMPPFTEEHLIQALEALCGAGWVTAVTDVERCRLTVRIPPRGPAGAVSDMLARRLPANIALDLDFYYATHNRLGAYRHGGLAAHTHKTIKEMV